MQDEASLSSDATLRKVNERDCLDLKRAINAAIRSQADRWGIRFDQAQALLLDRKVVA